MRANVLVVALFLIFVVIVANQILISNDSDVTIIEEKGINNNNNNKEKEKTKMNQKNDKQKEEKLKKIDIENKGLFDSLEEKKKILQELEQKRHYENEKKMKEIQEAQEKSKKILMEIEQKIEKSKMKGKIVRGSLNNPDIKKIIPKIVDNFIPMEEWERVFREVSEFPLFLDKKLEKLKIAFIVQEVNNDFYCSKPTKLKSGSLNFIRKPGPLGIFSQSHHGYFVSVSTPFEEHHFQSNMPGKTSSDPLSVVNIWQQKVTDCHFFPSLQEMYQNSVKETDGCILDKNSVMDIAEDWSTFDIVLTVDAPISSFETTTHGKKTVWAHYISERCMSSYQKSFDSPLEGYDLFLTQGFNLLTPMKYSPHVIEFPMSLVYPGIYSELSGKSYNEYRKKVSFCNGNEMGTLNSIKFPSIITKETNLTILGDINGSNGKRPMQIGEPMGDVKYFVCFYGDERRDTEIGDEIAEAFAFGSLVITNQNYLNGDLSFYSRTSFEDPIDALNFIIQLETDPYQFQRVNEFQKKLGKYLLFSRPIYQLLERANAVLQSQVTL